MGLYDAILENMPDAIALMARGMSPQLTSQAAHEDAIRCLQVCYFLCYLGILQPLIITSSHGFGLRNGHRPEIPGLCSQ